MVNYVVPSPAEIKEKYQKAKEEEDLVSHYILRFLSRNLTWIILHFTLLAEFVAMMTPVIDLIGIFLIFQGRWILAALLTQLHVVIDCVDGEVARFRATVVKRSAAQNKFGAFVDSMAGMLVFPVLILMAGVYMGSLLTGAVGMLLFSVNVLSSAYSKAYFPSKKKKGAAIRKKIFGNLKTKIAFSSYVQKSLVTLALLFQSPIFIWILSVGAATMISIRFYIYRK